MDNIERGHKTIRLLYKDFKHYFESGDILIGGSFYYKKIGCKCDTSYRDVDLIVDENKDYIVFEILNHYRNDRIWKINQHLCEENSNRFGDNVSRIYKEQLKPVGCLQQMIGYSDVDILRDNFDNLLPLFEIIPGVWTYGLSDLSMVKAYQRLQSEGFVLDKYKEIEEFFQERIKNNK